MGPPEAELGAQAKWAPATAPRIDAFPSELWKGERLPSGNMGMESNQGSSHVKDHGLY